MNFGYFSIKYNACMGMYTFIQLQFVSIYHKKRKLNQLEDIIIIMVRHKMLFGINIFIGISK